MNSVGWLRSGVVLLVATIPLTARSAEVYFMPGDSFFHASISEEWVTGLPGDGSATLTLKYSLPEKSRVEIGGGFAGFDTLRIDDVGPGRLNGVREAYRLIRDAFPLVKEVTVRADATRSERTLNPVHLYLYKAGYEVRRYGLGLKYREDWFEPPESSYHGESRRVMARAVLYVPFVARADAIAQDWRFAREVPELPVVIPDDVAWGMVGERIAAPVTARSADVLLVMSPDGPEATFQPRQSLCVWTITADGAVEKLQLGKRSVEMQQ